MPCQNYSNIDFHHWSRKKVDTKARLLLTRCQTELCRVDHLQAKWIPDNLLLLLLPFFLDPPEIGVSFSSLFVVVTLRTNYDSRETPTPIPCTTGSKPTSIRRLLPLFIISCQIICCIMHLYFFYTGGESAITTGFVTRWD